MKLTAILVENYELAKYRKKKEIVVYVLVLMKDIEIPHMKMKPEFILIVCEIIENQVEKLNQKQRNRIKLKSSMIS